MTHQYIRANIFRIQPEEDTFITVRGSQTYRDQDIGAWSCSVTFDGVEIIHTKGSYCLTENFVLTSLIPSDWAVGHHTVEAKWTGDDNIVVDKMAIEIRSRK